MVHHYFLDCLSSVLEAFPSKLIDQGGCTAGVGIVASDKSRCSPAGQLPSFFSGATSKLSHLLARDPTSLLA